MAEKILVRRAMGDDAKNVFELSNDPTVRANSINPQRIEWEGHLSWFEKAISDPCVKFYIAETQDGEFAGQVRFHLEGGAWIVSISVKEKFRGCGVGRLLLVSSMRQSGRRGFKALVKPENVSSGRLFAHCGYLYSGRISQNGTDFDVWRHDSVFVIAEMSANHCGDFEIAKKIVAAAKDAGADAVKMQTYTADTLTIDCKRDDFLIKDKDSLWRGRYLYDLYQKAATPWEWQPKLKEFADSIGILLFSTPFDGASADFLEKMDMPMYKIASFEAMDYSLVKHVAKYGKPMIISVGVSTLEEMQGSVDACREVGNNDITLLKCTSAYPAKLEDMNLLTIKDMIDRFGAQGVKIGLSDHSMSIEPVIAAIALGARVVEKHFTLDRALGGEDSGFSLSKDEFAAMVRAVRNTESVLGSVDYSVNPDNRKYARSLYAVKDIKTGDVFTGENVRSIRPSGGLHPKCLPEVLGRCAACDIHRGTPMCRSLIR